MRNFLSPIDFTDETNWTKTIFITQKENIAYQRKLLDNKIHAQIINQANEAAVDSLEATVADAVFSVKATG